MFSLHSENRRLVLHRIAHKLDYWHIPLIPRIISNVSRFFTGIEIHPKARIGRRFFIDHGMGVVVGETAIVGDDVLLYQGVILGGTSTEKTKRHPTVERGVIVGAGAKVMGNITIGEYSKMGTGAVVLKDVPSQSTCVGVPGRIVRRRGVRPEKVDLDHGKLPDPVADALRVIEKHLQDTDKRFEILYEKHGICLTEDIRDEQEDLEDLFNKDGD